MESPRDGGVSKDPTARPARSQNRRVTTDRVVVALLACSLIGWVVWALERPLCHPYADLACGNYSDHFSDMNVARAVTRVGVDVWRVPLGELGAPLSENEIAALPEDARVAHGAGMRDIAGFPADKPFVTSWADTPSFTPPGGLLLTAPVGLGYDLTGLSFADANRLLIAAFLIYAHLSLFVFFHALRLLKAGAIGFLGGLIVYGETIHLTLEGFSEAAVIAPLILCGLALYRGNGLAGVGWFVVAAALHLRTLFFLPLALYGVFLIIHRRQWKTWAPSTWAIATATVVGALLTGAVFLFQWPYLSSVAVTNQVNLTMLAERPDLAVLYAGMFGLLALVLVRARGWADLVVLVWAFALFTVLREAFPWNVLTLAAWIGMPIAASRHDLVRDVRLAALIFAAIVVFGNQSFPNPTWILQVI